MIVGEVVVGVVVTVGHGDNSGSSFNWHFTIKPISCRYHDNEASSLRRVAGKQTNKQENKILSEIIDPKQNPQLYNGGFYFELTTVTDMEWFCTI